MWASATSLQKLQRELQRLRDGCQPDDVIGTSHDAVVVSPGGCGGIWGRARRANAVEYSALVRVREQQ